MLKVCEDCQNKCKDDPNCKYVKLAKGEIKIKCHDCSYRVNQWCELYSKQFNLVMFKCIYDEKLYEIAESNTKRDSNGEIYFEKGEW